MNTLAELRKNKNLTQGQLAKALNISVSAVAMYETGARTPSLKKAKQISEYFKVPIQEINFFDQVSRIISSIEKGLQ